MYDKKHFNKINDKKVLHKVKKQWVTISLALFMMIGGGAVASHVHVSASQTQQPRTHIQVNNHQRNSNSTQHIISQANQMHSNILRNASLKKNKQTLTQRSHTKIGANHHSTNTHKPINTSNPNGKPNLLVNGHHIHKISNVNVLKNYQSGLYHKLVCSRLSSPFHKVIIKHTLGLHSDIDFNQDRIYSFIKPGHVLNISRTFKQYGHYGNYIRFEVPLSHKRNAFITGKDNFVSYVVPTTNYHYYQHKINNILKHSHNKKFNKIRESLNKLTKRRNKNYKTYVNLYTKTYNIQHTLKHPTVIDYNSRTKQNITSNNKNNNENVSDLERGNTLNNNINTPSDTFNGSDTIPNIVPTTPSEPIVPPINIPSDNGGNNSNNGGNNGQPSDNKKPNNPKQPSDETVTDTVDFNDTNKVIYHLTFTGKKGQSFNVNSQIPNGYKATTNTNLTYDGQTHVIRVAKITNSDVNVKDTIQFMNQNNLINTITSSGKKGQSFNVNSQIPKNYKATTTTNFVYDGKIHIVQVTNTSDKNNEIYSYAVHNIYRGSHKGIPEKVSHSMYTLAQAIAKTNPNYSTSDSSRNNYSDLVKIVPVEKQFGLLAQDAKVVKSYPRNGVSDNEYFDRNVRPGIDLGISNADTDGTKSDTTINLDGKDSPSDTKSITDDYYGSGTFNQNYSDGSNKAGCPEDRTKLYLKNQGAMCTEIHLIHVNGPSDSDNKDKDNLGQYFAKELSRKSSTINRAGESWYGARSDSDNSDDVVSDDFPSDDDIVGHDKYFGVALTPTKDKNGNINGMNAVIVDTAMPNYGGENIPTNPNTPNNPKWTQVNSDANKAIDDAAKTDGSYVGNAVLDFTTMLTNIFYGDVGLNSQFIPNYNHFASYISDDLKSSLLKNHLPSDLTQEQLFDKAGVTTKGFKANHILQTLTGIGDLQLFSLKQNAKFGIIMPKDTIESIYSTASSLATVATKDISKIALKAGGNAIISGISKVLTHWANSMTEDSVEEGIHSGVTAEEDLYKCAEYSKKHPDMTGTDTMHMFNNILTDIGALGVSFLQHPYYYFYK